MPPLVLGRVALADPLSAGLLLFTLPLVPVFLALVGLTTRDRTERSYATLAVLAAKVLDLLQGLPTLKVHGRAAGQVAAVGRVTERYRSQSMAALRWAFLSGLVLDLVATLSVALVAVSIGLRLQAGTVALTAALTVLLLAPEVYAPLRAVGTQYHASADALEAAAAALLLAAAPPDGQRGVLLAGEPVASLVDVTVRHCGRDVAALDRLSLTLAPGEVVCVQGPSGAGKSTLLAVLLGAVAPDGGTVVTADTGAAWRARLAWSPQRPRSSRPTAGEQARLGDPGAGDAEVAAALRTCDAPAAGTLLGEGGRAVSAARALLRARAVAARGEQPLVLLDEPSEDLDVGGEQVVARLVDSLRGVAAVVLVTHSSDLAQVADRHLRMHRGRVVADVRRPPVRSAAAPVGDTANATDPAVVYVEDVAEGVVRAVLAERLAHDTYNIGSGRGSTLHDLADAVRESFPSARIDVGPGLDYLQMGVDYYSVFDISRARQDFSYEPAYSLADGVRHYVETMLRLGLEPQAG